MGLYVRLLSTNDPPTIAHGSLGVVGGCPKIANFQLPLNGLKTEKSSAVGPNKGLILETWR